MKQGKQDMFYRSLLRELQSPTDQNVVTWPFPRQIIGSACAKSSTQDHTYARNKSPAVQLKQPLNFFLTIS